MHENIFEVLRKMFFLIGSLLKNIKKLPTKRIKLVVLFAIFGILILSILHISIIWIDLNWIKADEYRVNVDNAVNNVEMQQNPPTRMLYTNSRAMYRTIKNGWHDKDLEKISKKRLKDTYPESLKEMLIISEDKDFKNHNGISSVGFFRAIRYLGYRGSGSSITQQIARKIVPMNYDKTSPLHDKIEEQTIARILEERYIEKYKSKSEAKQKIILKYMNQVNLGTNVYGFRDAARIYFHLQPSDLSVSQQAELVSMLPEPESYTCPRSEDGKSLTGNKRNERISKNLEKMQKISKNLIVKYNKLTRQNESYKYSPFATVDDEFNVRCRGENYAEYFTKKVEIELKRISAKSLVVDRLYKSGKSAINTTLNQDIQIKAENILKENIKKYQSDGVGEGAIVLMETNTGKVRAMVGLGDEKNNPILQARPPASTFKIFTYLTALTQGISPNDSYPCSFQRPNLDKDFCTHYSEGRNINLFEALSSSQNVVTWNIAEKVGMRKVVETAANMFLSEEEVVKINKVKPLKDDKWKEKEILVVLRKEDLKKKKTIEKDLTELDYTFSGLIGQGDTRVSLMKMVQAYSTIANNGVKVKPIYVDSIFDTQQCKDITYRYKKCGDKIYKSEVKKEEKIKPKIAATLTQLLQGVIYDDLGTGKLARLSTVPKIYLPSRNNQITEDIKATELNTKVMREAGKTGTNAQINNETSDLWFIGYLPSKSLIAGVWLGPSTQKGIPPSKQKKIKSEDLSKKLGGNLASKVWHDFILSIKPELGSN